MSAEVRSVNRLVANRARSLAFSGGDQFALARFVQPTAAVADVIDQVWTVHEDLADRTEQVSGRYELVLLFVHSVHDEELYSADPAAQAKR